MDIMPWHSTPVGTYYRTNPNPSLFRYPLEDLRKSEHSELF